MIDLAECERIKTLTARLSRQDPADLTAKFVRASKERQLEDFATLALAMISVTRSTCRLLEIIETSMKAEEQNATTITALITENSALRGELKARMASPDRGRDTPIH